MSVQAGERFKNRLLKQDHHFITRNSVHDPIKVCTEIIRKCGMPAMSELTEGKMPRRLIRDFKNIPTEKRSKLEDRIISTNFANIDEDPLLDLLLAMLRTEPSARISALEGLEHEAFDVLKEKTGRTVITELDIIEELLRFSQLAKVGRSGAIENLCGDDADKLKTLEDAEKKLRIEPPFYRVKVKRYRSILDKEFLEAYFHEGDLEEHFDTIRWQKILSKLRMEKKPQSYLLLEFGHRHFLKPVEVNMLAVHLLKSGKVKDYCDSKLIETPNEIIPFPLLARLPQRWESLDAEKRETILKKVLEAPEYTSNLSTYLNENLEEFTPDELQSLFDRLRTRAGIFDTPLREKFETKWLWDHEMLGRKLDELTARDFLTDEIERFQKRLPRKDLTGLDTKYTEFPVLFTEVQDCPNVIVPDGHPSMMNLNLSEGESDVEEFEEPETDDEPAQKKPVSSKPQRDAHGVFVAPMSQDPNGTVAVDEDHATEEHSKSSHQEIDIPVDQNEDGGAEAHKKRGPENKLSAQPQQTESAISPATKKIMNDEIEPLPEFKKKKKDNVCCIIS